jgi:glycosyltransferase involved in cell wall biosynthesis
MRILIFHGYLLRGTGSNIYNANLACALVRLGHELHLVCQERHADALELPPGCTIHNPDIGRVLPVYVMDRYDDFEAVPFPQLDDAAIERYLEANVRAVRELAGRLRFDVALANHLVMGPAILARALGQSVPYAVKVHGSALEYTVRPHPERFLPYALEGVRSAAGVLVGSRHSAESLWEVTGDPELPARTRLGPPGVDVHAFRPRPSGEASERLERLAARLERGEAAAWGGDVGAADALRSVDPERDRVVAYVGKLIVSKGVDLLLAAWPLVVAKVPDARLLVVGFGTYRGACERIVRALADVDLEALGEVAARGRELEGGPPGELAYLRAFLDSLAGERLGAWAGAAPAAARRVHFTGRLEHDDLADVLPACEAQVVPSTFPESFGMVAVEAAACGALPLSAAHSGLAEVTESLAPALPPELRPLLAFERGPRAVEEIAARLVAWLRTSPPAREAASAALAAAARRRYSWESVAEGVVAAAEGRLAKLPAPAPEAPPRSPPRGPGAAPSGGRSG